MIVDGSVHRDRYEFMLYRQLRDRIEAGDVYCSDSGRYRSFEDDLVDEATWADKDKLLPQAIPSAAPINTQLAALKDVLNTRFDAVNERIRRGENSFVQFSRPQLAAKKVILDRCRTCLSKTGMQMQNTACHEYSSSNGYNLFDRVIGYARMSIFLIARFSALT